MNAETIGIIVGGGPAPGINGVISAATIEAINSGKKVVGIKGGFKALFEGHKDIFMPLTIDDVSRIHASGGSILRTSRDKPENAKAKFKTLMATLKSAGIKYLITIGGDGTLYMANWIEREARGTISVVHTPKTIDNDMAMIQKSFGFDTAIAEAVKAIQCAHVEARGAPNGIGLIKLMGRQSGHIAAFAALALQDTNFVLIPEVPFDLEGENGFLRALENRLHSRSHAVILVAEGAGQYFFQKTRKSIETDASGNIRLFDIGMYLKKKIERYFAKLGMEINLKYFDPSYLIRSVPANASDSLYCGTLSQYAVHAAMAGKTGMVAGLYNDVFVHLPMNAVASKRKTVDPDGNIWMQVLESTGQPQSMKSG